MSPGRSGAETTGAHDWTVTGWLLPTKVTFAALEPCPWTGLGLLYHKYDVALSIL